LHNQQTRLTPMKSARQILITGIFAAAVMAAAPSARAQIQTTGTPGSPSATTSIDGKQLPAPDPKFGGVIKDDALQSKPWWAPRIVPPKGAPNVLLIITDDSGFGVPSTFGGVVPTPSMDRVAKAGLRYNNIHSTALSSPTRAALITGRNDHSAGFGVISEQSTGFPGYNSIIGEDKATIGRILKDNGYATSWFGKITTCPRSPPARLDHSTNGRPGWASNISTASSAAMPTSGRRTSSATPPRFIPSRASLAGTSSPPWPTTPSIT
jgi:hypothetical protein